MRGLAGGLLSAQSQKVTEVLKQVAAVRMPPSPGRSLNGRRRKSSKAKQEHCFNSNKINAPWNCRERLQTAGSMPEQSFKSIDPVAKGSSPDF